MDRLTWKFLYKNYTECFCFVKSSVAHMHDTKTSNSEAQLLKYVDELMRENSKVGGISMGILTATVASVFSMVNPRKNFNRPFFAFRLMISAYTIYKIEKFYDLGCHISMMTGMPEVFEVLLSLPGSNIHQKTLEFISSLES